MKNQIKTILTQVLKQDITDDIRREQCPGWDSLAQLNLVIMLEAEFSVSIEPEDFVKMNDIDSIKAIILKYKK